MALGPQYSTVTRPGASVGQQYIRTLNLGVFVTGHCQFMVKRGIRPSAFCSRWKPWMVVRTPREYNAT
jgi:hypothetical protein